MIQHWANSQLYMSSVERLKREVVDLKPESQIRQEPPAYWPTDTGRIEVDQLAVRYAPDLPLALKGITFSIRPSVSYQVSVTKGKASTVAVARLFCVPPAARFKRCLRPVVCRQAKMPAKRGGLLPTDDSILSLADSLHRSGSLSLEERARGSQLSLSASSGSSRHVVARS